MRAVDDAWTRRTNKSITTNAQVIIKVYDCWLIKERGSNYIDCSDKSEIGKRNNNRLLTERRQGLVDIKRNKQLLIKDMKTDYGSGKVVAISITTATTFLTVWRNCSWKLAKLGVFIKHKTPIITALGYTSRLLIKKIVSTDSHSDSGRWCLNEENE